MIRLPEKVRKTLEKAVSRLIDKENVYGVGLFGSWSRGEAVASSDVDLLIVEKDNFDSEYVERVEAGGLLLDFDHVPKRWLHGMIPPDVDQKLYEMYVLYDRDWSLNDKKLLMCKSYGSPERVDIRTEEHVIDSDIYLSRATSAFSRGDFQSARLFAVVALESVLKVLVDVALQPFSNSRFLKRLEGSAAKLGMEDLYTRYLTVSRLNEARVSGANEKLKLFEAVWQEMKATTKRSFQVLQSSHFKIRSELNYYLNPAFLEGMLMRTSALIASGEVSEASHYLESTFLRIVEDYAWLRAQVERLKVDYSVLVRSLGVLEKRNPRGFDCMVRFLGLSDVTRLDAAGAIEGAREIMLKVRRERNALIKRHLLGA